MHPRLRCSVPLRHPEQFAALVMHIRGVVPCFPSPHSELRFFAMEERRFPGHLGSVNCCASFCSWDLRLEALTAVPPLPCMVVYLQLAVPPLLVQPSRLCYLLVSSWGRRLQLGHPLWSFAAQPLLWDRSSTFTVSRASLLTRSSPPISSRRVVLLGPTVCRWIKHVH